MHGRQRGLISTPLPLESEAWSPSWAEVQFTESHRFQLVSKIGKYLVGESGPGEGRKLFIFDTDSRSIVASKDLPTRSDGKEINVIAGGDGTFIFAATGTKDFFSAQGQTMDLYRVSFTNGTPGEWEAPVALMTIGSATPGRDSPAPVDPVDPDDGMSFRIENIVISPHNKIYLSFLLIPDNGPTKGCNQPIYVSNDLGVTFVEETFPGVTPSAGMAHACTPMRGASFQGSTYLIEGLLSSDAGASRSSLWSLEQQDPVLADWKTNKSISLDPSVVFVSPQNCILLRHKNGYVRAFNPGGGDWSDRTWAVTSGFLAIDLKSIAKGYANPNNAIISSVAGWSISNNFLSEKPTWQENYCPNADCYGGTGVAADPRTDKSNVFIWGETRGSTVLPLGTAAYRLPRNT